MKTKLLLLFLLFLSISAAAQTTNQQITAADP